MSPTDLLTVEQRTVLHNLGGWMIADALIDPSRGCAALRTGMWGGTYSYDGQHAFFDCTKRGIVVFAYASTASRDDDSHEPARERVELVVVRWSQLTRYVTSLSTDVRDQVRTARTEMQNAWLAVCGPIPQAGHNPVQRDPDEVEALRQTHRTASDRLDEALSLALPLDEAPEQLDLFAATA